MQKIKLTRPCSIDLSKEHETEQGAFCSLCSKDVIDFRNMTPHQIKEALRSNRDTNPCGTFNYKQLINPFDDFRDRILHWYTTLKKRKSIYSSILLRIVLVVMFLTSCRVRKSDGLSGAYAWSKNMDKDKKVEMTIRTKI
jgi:hypothetical protein